MNRRGVTLIELVLVVAIVGLIAGLSFPAVNSGIDSIRLQSAANSVASFLNGAMNRAERRQSVIEVVIDPQANQLALHSSEAGYQRTLEMPPHVALAGDQPHTLLFLPGGSVPRFAIDLVNGRGARKRVSVDPISGAPQISIPPEGQ